MSLMDEMAKVMDEYLANVTPEQFEKDLIDAGIENCPNINEDDSNV